MNFIRYEESRPEAMRAMLKSAPVAYIPFGALEWHGEHAPLGLDGIKAHALCEAAAERTGGVVFPVVYWGEFDTMPFPFTFNYRKTFIRNLIRETLRQLKEWGFKVTVLLAGHYPPAQIRLMREECRRFNKAGGAFAIGAPEQVFALDIEYYGDHAGMWETSIMMAIRPELVDLSAMPGGLTAIERLEKYGVIGHDPTSEASSEKGHMAIERIVSELADVVQRVMKEKNDRAFEEVYERYRKTMNYFSIRILDVGRKALGVRSVRELIQCGIWMLRHS